MFVMVNAVTHVVTLHLVCVTQHASSAAEECHFNSASGVRRDHAPGVRTSGDVALRECGDPHPRLVSGELLLQGAESRSDEPGGRSATRLLTRPRSGSEASSGIVLVPPVCHRPGWS